MRREQTGFVTFGVTATHFIGMDAGTGAHKALPKSIVCTKAALDALPLQQTITRLEWMDDATAKFAEGLKQRQHWIDGITGFGVLVGRSKRSWVVSKQVKGTGQQRFVTLGDVEGMTPEEARTEARRLISEMDRGIDPRDKKRELKRAELKRAVTLRTTFEEFKSVRQIKPETVRRYEQALLAKVPQWMDRPLLELDFELIRDTFKPWVKVEAGKKVAGASYAAQTLTLLGTLWTFARITWPGVVNGNPFADAKKSLSIKADRTRRDHIPVGQLPLFFEALSGVEKAAGACISARLEKAASGCNKVQLEQELRRKWQIGIDFVLFLLSTGLRRNEAATLRWENIDDLRDVVTIHDTKNGQAHALPLTSFHRAILGRLREQATASSSPWVFPSTGRKNRQGHLVEIDFVMKPTIAGLGTHLTVHGLRRSFGTLAYAVTRDYLTTKRLMNHASSDVTAKHYLQTSMEDLRGAMERICDELMKAKAKAQGMTLQAAS